MRELRDVVIVGMARTATGKFGGSLRDVPAPVASLLMSLESVFSALFAALLLHDFLQPRELLGSALMLTAVLVVQLWRPRRACAQPPR